MNLLRSKQNKEVLEQTQSIFKPECDVLIDDLLKRIVYAQATSVAPTLFAELALEPWLAKQCSTLGGKRLFPQLVAHPIYDIPSLRVRQDAAKRLSSPRIPELLKRLQDLEPDVLWIYSLPSIKSKEAWPFRLLFPTWPVVSMINHIPPFLAFYHIFRSYLAPWSNLIYPLSTILGPYVYIKRTLKWPISFAAYIAMLKLALTHMLRPAATPTATLMRYITLLAYVGMFLYGVLQSFDLAAMLRDILQQLNKKLEAVREFVATFETLQKETGWDPTHWCAFLPSPAPRTPVSVAQTMTCIHTLWNDREIRTNITYMLQHVYAVDMAYATYKLQRSRGWCIPQYDDNTALLSMGHPLLDSRQVRNPLALTKNIIITGPNAAGKTTYMKAICCNQLLAQSLGVVCARSAIVNVVHAIGSFIRVGDTVGKDSLFEAEAKRCADMIDEATRVTAAGQRALYFLDEPMHSTPPIEGAATAMAVVRHLAAMKGVRVFVTTHYHTMIDLETEDPENFINVSMEALTNEGSAFHFPYRLRKGSSRQCIAIDLLTEKGFPEPFIQSAIRYKNKICRAEVDRNHDAT